MANAYLCNGYREDLALFADKIREIKEKLCKKGFSIVGGEDMKLTLDAKKYGYYGYEIAEYLLENGIVCEFSDPDFVVLMLTLENADGVERLSKVLASLPKKDEIKELAPLPEKCQSILSVREAIMSPSVEIPVSEAKDRILAAACVSCPPAIPILVCGERIDERTIECFKYYGVEKCRVVDED
jgi:arginine/lysine/ornithine decarboxylase